MANEDQLGILQQGVEAWNKWREENIDVVVDLSWANLSKANLSGANLSGTNLSWANLSKANLSGANLSGTNLSVADLSGANLIEAYLNFADLSGTKLTGANLSRARLYRTHLYRSDLIEANLSEANLGEANLIEAHLFGANLREAALAYADLSDAKFCRAKLNSANMQWTKLLKADLSNADLSEANLWKSNLSWANLRDANLIGAGLSEANLSMASLRSADLSEANLSNTNLRGANLSGSNLSGANLTDADLLGADLSGASLIKTTLMRTILTGCRIYGVSAWELKLDNITQRDLIITPANQPTVTVDNIEVAQFVYLLLHNEKIRGVIDTIAKKAVLILGSFKLKERKDVLDALRTELRKQGYLPIVFDFEKPKERDFTETIRVLAGMSLFVIADITNPKSCPLELQATVPDYMVPFVPIIQEDEEPFSMFKDLHIHYKRWVLAPLKYDSSEDLIRVLDRAIIQPALQVHDELLREKAAALPIRHVKDYM
jgi:uncharacterized protein YjbI with pentapeptide repeats